MLRAYPSLAKLRLSEHQEKFWADEVKIIERLNGLRGAGRKAVFYDRKTSKKLSLEQYGKIEDGIKASKASLKSGPFWEWYNAIQEELANKVKIRSVPTPADDPAKVLAGIPPEKINDCQRVLQSRRDAQEFLILRARGLKTNVDGKIAFGRHRLDGKKFVLAVAASSGNLIDIHFNSDLAQIIHQAAQERDIQFFKILGRSLSQKSRRSAELDWNDRCESLPCFLVDFWIGWPSAHPDFPPLCFFTDQALADWCGFALTPESDGGHFDAVRKCRQRLRLKRAETALIKSVTTDAKGAILLG
jgi:hypothetical protein